MDKNSTEYTQYTGGGAGGLKFKFAVTKVEPEWLAAKKKWDPVLKMIGELPWLQTDEGIETNESGWLDMQFDDSSEAEKCAQALRYSNETRVDANFTVEAVRSKSNVAARRVRKPEQNGE